MSGKVDRAHEKDVLERLRFAAQATADDRWLVETDGEQVFIIAARATGEDVHICTIHADALEVERRLIGQALEHMRLFLGLFDRAAGTVRDLKRQLGQQERKVRAGDYAAQAAMLLDDRRFQRFLEGKGAGGPVRDKGAADTRLKSLLRLESKRQLNSEDWAREAWKRLMGEFDAWKRGG